VELQPNLPSSKVITLEITQTVTPIWVPMVEVEIQAIMNPSTIKVVEGM